MASNVAERLQNPNPDASAVRTQSAAIGAGDDGALNAVESREREDRCPNCLGNRVRWIQVQAGEMWIPGNPPVCQGCEIAAEEWTRRLEVERRKSQERTERSRRRENIRELLEAAGSSPWEHGHCTFENFDTSECGPQPLKAAREFVGRVLEADRYAPIPGVYFAGTTGSGKSHLGTAICRALLLEPSIDPRFVVFDPADVLASRIRSLYGGRGDVDAFLRRRENARVWILDDLGREPPHPDVVGHLTMLLSQRAMRPTVITGNLHPEEYEERHLDLARIGSRLGPAYFETVTVRGRDRRFDG